MNFRGIRAIIVQDFVPRTSLFCGFLLFNAWKQILQQLSYLFECSFSLVGVINNLKNLIEIKFITQQHSYVEVSC